MPGAHHVLNVTAAIAIADELGVDMEVIKKSLEAFEGVQRRFSVLGDFGGVTIVDDYGHHPSEIEATLEAAQRAYAGRRIVVAFQPHRFTRTRDLFDELVVAFNHADVVLLSDVYAAGEQPIEGADSKALAEAIRLHGHRDISYVGELTKLVPLLSERLQEGDVLVTLGAGNITATAPAAASMLSS